jgi:hypothetical protein
MPQPRDRRITHDAAHEIFVMSRKRAGKPLKRHPGFRAFVAGDLR